MVLLLPRFAVLKAKHSKHYVNYIRHQDVALYGYVGDQEEKCTSPTAKIEIEKAKIDSRYVHLRFCYSNKYLGKRSETDNSIYGISNQPEEDISNWSCTMFEPTLAPNGSAYHFIHVQTGYRLDSQNKDPLYIRRSDEANGACDFYVTDWETLVVLPERIALQHYSGKWLRRWDQEGHPYLNFGLNSYTDGPEAAFEVTTASEGYVRLRADNNRFWRLSPYWIWADSADEFGIDTDTLFSAVQSGDNIIALLSEGCNLYCCSVTADGKTACLNANSSTVVDDGRFGVQELVSDRQITEIVFLMQYARIYDETPIIAGSGTTTNRSSEKNNMSIAVSYKEYTATTFGRSQSVTGGVISSITVGIPFIERSGEISFSTETTESLEWGKTKSQTKTIQTTYAIPVPHKSIAKVKMLATKGTCNIPFTYVQRDKLSTDGRVVSTPKIDGVFTGVYYYGFHYDEPAFEPIQ